MFLILVLAVGLNKHFQKMVQILVVRYFFSINPAYSSSVQIDIPYDNSNPYAGGNPVTTTVQSTGGDCYFVDVIYSPPLIPLGPGSYYQFRLKLGTGGNPWMTPSDDVFTG